MSAGSCPEAQCRPLLQLQRALGNYRVGQLLVAGGIDGKGRIREIYHLQFFRPDWVLEDVRGLLGEK